MSLPVLYSFRRCPYAMRARMSIVREGFDVELREVVLRDRPDHMMEISPKGTVPVLLLPDGTVIEESLEIMQHVLDWDLSEEDYKKLNGLSTQKRMVDGSAFLSGQGPYRTLEDLWDTPDGQPEN